MQFELTKDYLDLIRLAIDSEDGKSIVELIEPLHVADIAEILDNLEFDELKFIYKHIDKEKAAEVFVHLEEDMQEMLLDSLTSKEIAEQFIESMDSDDAADIISELSDSKKEEVLSHIEDIEQASDIADLLTFEEGTAGALMAKELIKVNVNWLLSDCIVEMRKQAEDVENIFTVYAVNDFNKLLGIVSLKQMLLSPPNSRIMDIYDKDVISVKTRAGSEEIAKKFEKYDLVVIPVIDELGRLVGRITVDDIVDVMKEEAEKDYQMASGHSEVVESSDTVWRLSRARLPWLVIGLFGGIIGANVIGLYEDQIRIYPQMAFFIPLIAAMGGNVGVQSSAIIVQSIANKSLGSESVLQKLFKEFNVALLNGLVCSALILGYNMMFGDSYNLSVTVSIALFSVIVFAGVFGTLTPLVLDKYEIDPALATGPFITTVNDVCGLMVYFSIGRMMYL